MATCGDYELERAIGWGRRSTFFAARVSNDGGPSLIVIRRARSGDRAFGQAFLRAAAEQQTAVGAGCRQIAPILAFEHDGDGFAYYATTRYETSLAEFLEAGCKVDSALLREIVGSALGALTELHEKSRRAHGNLTPGNILLDPHGRIFLTDLAPAAKDATTADDLFALGKLIYQLVRRTARIGTLNPPLDYSPAWTESLGDDAEGWLAFTNRVLDKPRNASPNALKSAQGDLKSLAGLAAKAAKAARIHVATESGVAPPVEIRRPPPKKKNPVPTILVILLLLGGGGGGFLWWKKQEAKKTEQVKKDREEDVRRKRLTHLPPSLKNLRSELKNVADEIKDDKTLHSRLLRIADSLGEAPTQSIEKDTENNLREWSVPDKMKARADEWRAEPRAWKNLADNLQAASKIALENETSLITQVTNVISANKEAGELDFLWADVERSLKDLAAKANPLLPDFSDWAENEIRGTSDLQKATARAKETVRLLGTVLAFQDDFGARVRWARLEEKVPDIRQKPSEELMRTWPADWVNKAKEFVAPEPGKIAAWEKQLAAIDARFQKLSPKDPKKAGWKQKLDSARSALREPLESDAAEIEKKLAGFTGMQTDMEIAHDQYSTFLDGWKAEVKKLADLNDAKAAEKRATTLLKEFQDVTNALLPEYKVKLGNSKLAATMQGHLDTPKRINLAFLRPDGSPVTEWRQAQPPSKYEDPNAACYAFVKNSRDYAYMHFLPIDSEYAMAVWETPLVLARLSGATAAKIQRDQANVPTEGPQTRDDNFYPAADWQWKSVKDLLTVLSRIKGGRPSYFAQGLDSQPPLFTDKCPVTWLSFDEAKQMAEKLGGKLPTAKQWKDAYKTLKPGAEARLRSSEAWSKQSLLIDGWKKDTGDPFLVASTTADYGSFSKQLKESDSETGPAGGRDKKLWLAEVGDANWKPADGFIHLVGNAAEWVTDDTDKPAVIGSSVVAPKIPPDRAFNVTNSAFFDVTFRFVVRLGEGGAGIGLKKFVDYAAGLTAP